MKISVRNRQRKIAFALRPLQALARQAARVCLATPGQPGAVLPTLQQVEVSILSDAAVAELHQRFMNISGPTDVLTFGHGEIVIGAETALANAAAYQSPLERELALYIVHGLLHLHGFDDQSETDSREMRRMESEILSRCDNL